MFRVKVFESFASEKSLSAGSVVTYPNVSSLVNLDDFILSSWKFQCLSEDNQV